MAVKSFILLALWGNGQLPKRQPLKSGLYYKNIMIVNDTSRVVRMAIASDATTWSVTYGRQLCS
jgi:hypothetical protein